MRLFSLLICLVIYINGIAQNKPLTYYLPDVSYDSSIPSPAEVLGYQIGDWHMSHDQQLYYLKMLAAASPRITLTEYARSYENRPLVYLTITSAANHENLEAIRTEHLKLSDPNQSANMSVSDMPLVVYQGFNIHGNEPSGGNGAVLVAYYLAAGKSKELDDLLANTVILLDPCLNPDGFNRFASWVNTHKNKNLTSDPNDREYDEVWPRGRTNHYWFDLNRDWLLLQHPESRGRIHAFHQWKPNILTDHHEMGSNATYFFMPGEPQRTNPITPEENQVLTGKIATFHAAALDEIGSLYYSKEGFDDFYYGKGSTYPDANGCIGILFEQASSRGHLQETVNGLLSFPFTIRNQVTTALSTQKAGVALREELLTFQRDYYQEGMAAAQKDERYGFVFGESSDATRQGEFLDILTQHQINVYPLKKDLTTAGKRFEAGAAYVVPLAQQQYHLIRGIFETSTTFKDSLFYDVSSWTLPLAFNIPYAALSKKTYSPEQTSAWRKVEKKTSTGLPSSNYAYLLQWEDYASPRALYAILQEGLRAKVSTRPFKLAGKDYAAGTILIPVYNQEMSAEAIHEFLQSQVQDFGATLVAVPTGNTLEGPNLGSNTFRTLQKPNVLLVVGPGVSSYEAGEVWHLLDQRYDMPISKVEASNLNYISLSKYNVIVMVDGSYSRISNEGVANIKDWLEAGGTIIGVKRAMRWLNSKGLAKLTFQREAKAKDSKVERRPYGNLSKDYGANVIGGAIFEVNLDLTHPLAFGYNRDRLPVFRRGTLFLEPTKNSYATPAVYTDSPLLSGYTSEKNKERIKNSAAIVVSGLGRGKAICLADNPNFRAFWYGTTKIFANAVFFGSVISGSSIERASGKVQTGSSED